MKKQIKTTEYRWTYPSVHSLRELFRTLKAKYTVWKTTVHKRDKYNNAIDVTINVKNK